MNALEAIREKKRCGERLTAIEHVIWAAHWAQDPFAKDAAEENAKREAVIEAARGLLEYRKRSGPLNFQLEKADDYLRIMRESLAALKEQK